MTIPRGALTRLANLRHHELIAVALGSLAYTLLFNLPQIWFVHQTRDSMAELIMAFALSYAAVLFLFILLSASKTLYTVMVPILFILSSIPAYFLLHNRIILSTAAIHVLMETNLAEAAHLLSRDFFLWIIIHAGTAALVVAFHRTRIIPMPLAPKAIAATLCVIIQFQSIGTAWSGKPHASVLPYGIIVKSYRFIEEKKELAARCDEKNKLAGVEFLPDKGPMTVVIILGESSRGDHYHINGYEKQTSPNLERLGAVPFPNARSLHTLTMESIPVLLTRTDPYSGEAFESSFITGFNRAGFRTSWISLQGTLGRTNVLTHSISHEASRVRIFNPLGEIISRSIHDGTLLGELDRELQTEDDKKLIILHSIGSHWKYDAHYPDRFKTFLPVCPGGFNPSLCGIERLVNSYDNSILYTDYIIGQVIERVKNRTALVIYISDHGESLGEEGRYLHGGGPEAAEQYRIAAFAWASPGYRRRYGEMYRALKGNGRKEFDQRVLFHTALHGAGIKSAIIDHALSLCSSRFTGISTTRYGTIGLRTEKE